MGAIDSNRVFEQAALRTKPCRDACGGRPPRRRGVQRAHFTSRAERSSVQSGSLGHEVPPLLDERFQAVEAAVPPGLVLVARSFRGDALVLHRNLSAASDRVEPDSDLLGSAASKLPRVHEQSWSIDPLKRPFDPQNVAVRQ